MDDRIEILLNSKKNIDSVNKQVYGRVEFESNKIIFNELDITNITSASDVFNQEREETQEYRIYGKFEYLSLLNGIKTDYDNLDNLFIKSGTTIQTIYNSFDFYLVRPSTGFTNIPNSTNYIRNMEIIATPENFDIFNSGFGNNVYGDNTYSFIINKDIDVSNYLDYFGMPLTDIYLYPKYKINGSKETLYETKWVTTTGLTRELTSTQLLKIGDIVNGDIVSYNLEEYSQVIIENQKYLIRTYFSSGSGTTVYWTYNPFIQIKLRYFSSDLSKANKLTTSYEQVNKIPEFAIQIPNQENYVWREIIKQGNFDPFTNEGVDYPFVNKKRYLFLTSIIDVIPDMTNSATISTLGNIKYGTPIENNTSPSTDVNDIGKPCQ